MSPTPPSSSAAGVLPRPAAGSDAVGPSASADGLVLRLLKQTMPFRGVSDEMLQSIARLARPVSYRPGDVIYREHDRADDVFIVISGQVQHTLTQSKAEGEATRVLRTAACSAGPLCSRPTSGCAWPARSA